MIHGTRSTPTSTALVPWTDPEELKRCQEALGDIEILIYEAWEGDNSLTKDAARRFLLIADICEWDTDWVFEMREWVK